MEYYKNLDLQDIVYFCEVDLIEKTEQWKDVPNYEGMYQISDLGRMKSLERYVKTRNTGTKLIFTAIKKQQISERGYLQCSVSKYGKKHIRQTHLFVAESFFNHKPNGLVVDHIKNHERTNNSVYNLQIITTRENTNKDPKKGTSKYIGVSWNIGQDKWVSKILLNNKNFHLGYFYNEIDAYKAYNTALTNWNLHKTLPEDKIYSSIYKGVSWRKTDKKWRASIYIENKLIHIGNFTNEEEANIAHQTALKNWDEKGIKPDKPKYSSKYKGVCYDKQSNKWRARKTIDGKLKDFGAFHTEIEAYNALN